MTPSLPAAQPATLHRSRAATIRPLGKENDKAFALINALDADAAQPGDPRSRVADLVLGPGQDGRTIQPEGHPRVGVDAGAADDAARSRPRVGGHRDRRVRRAADGGDPGQPCRRPTSRGAARRRTAAPPTSASRGRRSSSNTRRSGSVDHIHTIYRDPTNDYGAKLVAK